MVCQRKVVAATKQCRVQNGQWAVGTRQLCDNHFGMVVTLPTANVSIAFASPSLPFDQETLAEMVRESGEEAFVILDNTAVRAIAENTTPP